MAADASNGYGPTGIVSKSVPGTTAFDEAAASTTPNTRTLPGDGLAMTVGSLQ
jgi:hypothetical protein